MTAHFQDESTSRVSPLDVNGYVPANAPGLDARTRNLIKRRADVLGPASPLMYRNPVEIIRAQGLRLHDRDGTTYLGSEIFTQAIRRFEARSTMEAVRDSLSTTQICLPSVER